AVRDGADLGILPGRALTPGAASEQHDRQDVRVTPGLLHEASQRRSDHTHEGMIRGAPPARPEQARGYLTALASARSLSVATTRFESSLRTSMVSWGRLRISHSSRSSLMTSSSVSLAAMALAERGPLRKSAMWPKIGRAHV